MTTPRLNLPPRPSTPRAAPWDDLESALVYLTDNLTALGKVDADLLAVIKAIKALAPGGGGGASLFGLYMYEDVGTVSQGGAQTQLSDNKKVWQPNMWRGHTLFVVIDGILYITPITSNGMSQLIFTQLPALVPQDAPYWITAGTSGSLLTKTAVQILNLATIAAAATSTLAQCDAIDLSAGQQSLAITVGCTYNPAAVAGIRIHVRTSYDGTNYDTVDWDTWIPGFTAGADHPANEGL